MMASNKHDWWHGNALDRLREDCKRDWYADNSIHLWRALADPEREAKCWIKANALDWPDRLADNWLADVKQDLYQSINWQTYCDNTRNDVILAFKYALDEREGRGCSDVPPEDLTDAERLYWQAGCAARIWARHWRTLEQKFAEEAAAQRARRLLVGHLTPSQKADFERSGTFRVVSSSNRCYRIRQECFANVDVLDVSGAVCHRLCAHPAMNVPVADVMLAQLLMLRYDEEQFLQLAKVHPAIRASQNLPGANETDANEMVEMAATLAREADDYRRAV